MFNFNRRKVQAVRMTPAQLERRRAAVRGEESKWEARLRTAFIVGMGITTAVLGWVLLVVVMGSPELLGVK